MKVDEIIETQWNISDLQNLENVTPLLVKENFNKSLFLLLGYTLGNFEIHDILYQVRSSMKNGDVLVIVTGVGNTKWKKWIENAADDKKLKMNSFLIYIPLQLGLNKEDVEFGARLQNSRVEYYYTLKKDKSINFQNKTLNFQEGDQIVVAVAYKHDKNYLKDVLSTYFNDVVLKYSEDDSTVLALCKK